MKIFIPRVPSVTTSRELKRLVERVLEKKFHIPFTKHPSVRSCDILQFKDGNGVVEFHGLVSVYPDEAGTWLISHFKKQRLHNKLLFARQFMDRSREQNVVIQPEDDRRRKNLDIAKVTTVDAKVEAIDVFRREYGS
ncbi:hypothetical protein [Sedimenticola sp.]|uniref:hypothetical protein n=1 Tax=Sedimenticola sp. TaxID=1940285 RepID=UPI003D0CB6E7